MTPRLFLGLIETGLHRKGTPVRAQSKAGAPVSSMGAKASAPTCAISKRFLGFVPCTALLHLDAASLDDGPPLFDFEFLERAKGFRILLIARWNLHPKVRQTRSNVCICQCRDHCFIELCNYIFGRSPRNPKRRPVSTVELGQSRFVNGWNVRRRRQAAL